MIKAVRGLFDTTRPESIRSFYRFAGFLAVAGAVGITTSVLDTRQQQELMRTKEAIVRSETAKTRKLNSFNSVDSAGVETVCRQSENILLQAKAAWKQQKVQNALADSAIMMAKIAHNGAKRSLSDIEQLRTEAQKKIKQ